MTAPERWRSEHGARIAALRTLPSWSQEYVIGLPWCTPILARRCSRARGADGKEEPDLSTGLPVRLVASHSVRRNLNAHDVLEHAVEAAEDGELVHLLRDLLQRLELLEAQQRRVLVHESGG